MAINATFAVVNAFFEPRVFTIFCAYFSLSPLMLVTELIHPHWLRIETGGGFFAHFRAMMLWPITVYECQITKFRIARLKQLVAKIEALPEKDRMKAPEMKELLVLKIKMSKFTDKAKKTATKKSFLP